MAGVPSEATCSRTSLLIRRWRDTPGGIGTVGTVAAPDRVTDGRHEVDRRQRLHQVASHARRSAFLMVAAVPMSSDDSSGAANSLATAHEIWVTNPLLSTPQRRVPVSTRSPTLPRRSEWRASAKNQKSSARTIASGVTLPKLAGGVAASLDPAYGWGARSPQLP